MKKKTGVPPLHVILRDSDPYAGTGDILLGSQNLYPRELFRSVEDAILKVFHSGQSQSFDINDGSQGRYRVTVERVSQKGAGK